MRGWGKKAASLWIATVMLHASAAAQGLATNNEAGNDKAGLTLLDVLEASLKRNPDLAIQRYGVSAQAGVLRTAAGQFDWVLRASGEHGRDFTAYPLDTLQAGGRNGVGLPTQTSTLSFAAQKQMRNGIQISPELVTTRSVDAVNYPAGVNQGQVGLRIELPLLRDRGKKAVDAVERSAGKEFEAARYELSQSITDTLSVATTHYWNYAAVLGIYEVYRASAMRGGDILNNTETLVAADRLPANDLNQVRANYASRQASLTAAEQQLVVARQQLVVIMGRPVEDVLTLPLPSQTTPPPVHVPGQNVLQAYLQLAAVSRGDVRAAQLKKESMQALEERAKNQTKPLFNLTGQGGYAAIQPGRGVGDLSRSLVGNDRSATFSVGLRYSQTPANDVAQGQLAVATANLRQSEILLANTLRVAQSEVVVAFEAVRRTLSQVEEAHSAVEHYQAALDGEREKYRLGLNSLVDVLTVEDRLTSVVIAEVNARLDYALSLVQLRRATGTVVPLRQDVQQIDPAIFSFLPAPVTNP